jgi:aldose 1-epimerase
MKKSFGILPDGSKASLYTIKGGDLTAEISDLGATVVKLFVPDSKGNLADVVLGFDDPNDYIKSGTYFGTIVGRNANRVGKACFVMDSKTYALDTNDNGKNNLHSGFSPYKNRLWKVERHDEDSIRFSLQSPDGDQGFPGNATIHVTYTIDPDNALRITYDAVCDKDSKAFRESVIAYTQNRDTILSGLIEKPQLVKLPIVRNGRLATVGYQPDVWEKWIEEKKI